MKPTRILRFTHIRKPPETRRDHAERSENIPFIKRAVIRFSVLVRLEFGIGTHTGYLFLVFFELASEILNVYKKRRGGH